MSKYIIAFQAKNGLKPDGVIGKITLTKIKQLFGLNNFQLAHLMGQAHVESMGFTTAYENLNYSSAGLLDIFPKYFDKVTALQYARKPEMIANRAYANRMGNGNEASGMGYKFRGRGALQLTGYNNYKLFSKFVGKDVTANPDLVAEEYFLESAVFYFNTNSLFAKCVDVTDKTILGISRAVNLGNFNSKNTPHGLAERKTRTIYYYNLIK